MLTTLTNLKSQVQTKVACYKGYAAHINEKLEKSKMTLSLQYVN